MPESGERTVRGWELSIVRLQQKRLKLKGCLKLQQESVFDGNGAENSRLLTVCWHWRYPFAFQKHGGHCVFTSEWEFSKTLWRISVKYLLAI